MFLARILFLQQDLRKLNKETVYFAEKSLFPCM